MALDRRGGGHLRADEVGAAAAALAALEVAVRGRGAALAGLRMSGFMPRHIEQPAPRQSKPASRKISSRPSCLGLRLHLPRARHDHRVDVGVRPCAPSRPSAAARRSSMREFVQEPMKTRSRRMSSIGVPACEAHVLERALGRRRVAPGRGTASPTPHDHLGVRAPGDLRADLRRRRPRPRCRSSRPRRCGSPRQRSTPRPSRRPSARPGGPATYANVVSSGAIMPARPPPSIVMLQTVMRPSIESASIAGRRTR